MGLRHTSQLCLLRLKRLLGSLPISRGCSSYLKLPEGTYTLASVGPVNFPEDEANSAADYLYSTDYYLPFRYYLAVVL